MLSEKQQLFCRFLAAGQEPAQAARNAGYQPRGAAGWARRNLANREVQAELQRMGAAALQTASPEGAEQQGGSPQGEGVAQETEILRFLTGVMRGEVKDGSAGQQLPKVSERTKAAELLGRSQRLFSDKPAAGRALEVRIWGEEDLLE